MITRPGFWCDVCAHPDGLAFAYCVGPSIGDCPRVLVEVNGVEAMLTTAPSTPRYLRIACDPLGNFGMVGQAQDGSGLLLYQAHAWHTLCPCYAAPAIAWDVIDGFIAYTQVTGRTYRYYANGVLSEERDIPIGLTSAGISQILDDGTIVWAQTARERTIRGTTLLVTMEVAGVVTGQSGGVVGGIPVDAGEPFLALDAPGMDPRLAYSPVVDRYAVCSWTQGNVACYQELPPFPPLPPPPVNLPEIAPFGHAVMVAPFKDPEHKSGCPQDAEGIGILCTQRDSVIAAVRRADLERKRVTFYWDGDQPPVIPPELRPWDQVWIEFYRLKTETLAQSVERWASNLVSLSIRWQGDAGVIPQLYCQGGAPPHELWTVQEVIDGLAFLSPLIHGLIRVKGAYPFAFERTNGIVAHPEFQIMLDRIVAASPGQPVFVPIGPIPPPVHPSRNVTLLLETHMADGPIPVLNSSQFKPSNNGKSKVTVGNPLNQTYTNVGEKGWKSTDSYVGKDAILSINSFGQVSTRRPDADGIDEQCTRKAGMAVYENFNEGDPVSYLVPYDGLS